MEMNKSVEILDLSVVQQLREIAHHSDPTLFKKLVDLYHQDCARYVFTIETAIANYDLASAKRAAHALKSASRNMGAYLVADNCLLLEQPSIASVDQEMIQIAHTIKTEYRNACDALRQLDEGSV